MCVCVCVCIVFSEFKVDRCIASNRKDTADADYASLDFVDVGG